MTLSNAELIAEFRKCLGTVSYGRAGADYPDMPREQRERERQSEKDALARARAIWAENPGLHDELRAAFKAESPLARMAEIESPGT